MSLRHIYVKSYLSVQLPAEGVCRVTEGAEDVPAGVPHQVRPFQDLGHVKPCSMPAL
jgi:hypothetical protein